MEKEAHAGFKLTVAAERELKYGLWFSLYTVGSYIWKYWHGCGCFTFFVLTGCDMKKGAAILWNGKDNFPALWKVFEIFFSYLMLPNIILLLVLTTKPHFLRLLIRNVLFSHQLYFK